MQPLLAEYESEKGRVDEIKTLREKRDRLLAKIDMAKRTGDVSTASDLTYYALPECDARLRQLEALEEAKAQQVSV